MSDIDPDLDKYVENISNSHVWNGHQTTVTVVDNEVAAKLLRGKVVDATGAVGHVSENQGFDPASLVGAEALYYVGNNRAV